MRCGDFGVNGYGVGISLGRFDMDDLGVGGERRSRERLGEKEVERKNGWCVGQKNVLGCGFDEKLGGWNCI